MEDKDRLNEIRKRAAEAMAGPAIVTHGAGDRYPELKAHDSFHANALHDVSHLLSLLEARDRELAAWMDTAAQFSRNSEFYRGLITGIGSQFGRVAQIADDGTDMGEVLVAKVPELVKEALDKLRARLSPTAETKEEAK